jgi:TPP-dependent 2-oxoacid decarboxylase
MYVSSKGARDIVNDDDDDDRISNSKSPLAFCSFRIARYGSQSRVEKLLDHLKIPYLTTGLDKACIDESNPLFMGGYRGELSQPPVLEAIKTADLILDVGACVWDDLSTGFGSARVPLDKMITLGPDHVKYSKRSGNVQNWVENYVGVE